MEKHSSYIPKWFQFSLTSEIYCELPRVENNNNNDNNNNNNNKYLFPIV